MSVNFQKSLQQKNSKKFKELPAVQLCLTSSTCLYDNQIMCVVEQLIKTTSFKISKRKNFH